MRGYVTSIGNDLVCHDGSQAVKLGKLPGHRDGEVSVLNDVMIVVTPTYTDRQIVWRSRSREKWTKLRETKSGFVTVLEGMFVLIDKEKVFRSVDGLDWTYVTKLPFRPVYFYRQGRSLIVEGASDSMGTLNGSSWVLSRDPCVWIDGEPKEIGYPAAFMWKGKVVKHDRYNFCIDGEVIPHNFGRQLDVIANDRHIVVCDTQTFITDLRHWEQLPDVAHSLREVDGYIFSLGLKLTLISTPKWSVPTIANALPAQKRYHRNLLLSFRRHGVCFPLFMELISHI